MNHSESRNQYLAVYRQQLARETAAMGYGQTNRRAPATKRQSHNNLPIVAVFALAFTLLTLASTQM